MTTDQSELIVILGFSDHKSRYSYMAFEKLLEKGHSNIIGVNPRKFNVADIEHVDSLQDISKSVHTLTVYVRPEISCDMIDDIINISPTRIILNPGAENQNLKDQALKQGIEVIEACTLVMLSTDQF